MALSLDLAIGFAIVLVGSLSILGLYTHVEPYMDELFHIPQAQHYCDNHFYIWNQGITTFPGLYWFSFGVAKAIQLVVPSVQEHVCSPAMLRSINVLLSSILPILAYRCRKLISPLSSDSWIVAIIIFLYPLNLFYYYLYYTDTLSTVSLVLVYWYTLKLDSAPTSPSFLQKLTHFVLASACLMARQTNAVWLLFLAGTSMLHHLSAGGFVDDELSVSKLCMFVMYLWKNKVVLLGRTWPLLLPVLGFVGFVLHTGSIVLGDKDNHKPVLHFAMLSHSLFLISAVVAPLALLDVADVLSPKKVTTTPVQRQKTGYVRFVQSVLFYASVAVVVGYMLVAKSYSHPFLESDNRHYMFYLWKRYLSSTVYRLFLCPVYALFAGMTLYRLRRTRGPVWILIFLVALVVTLVPTPLLEPRYFTPGVVVALLNAPELDLSRGLIKLGALMIVVGMIAVNVATIYVFLYKPFEWGDGTMARFMY